jgi:glycosyltransferase involved in cell wall biosynthesis
MKILWVKSDFLHPTNRGGQIRTLEMLRRLHRRHEIHYVAYDIPAYPEGPRRAGEYSTRAYPLPHRVPSHRSPAFAVQLAAGLFSPLPVAVSRYRSAVMARTIAELRRSVPFDRLVCDFIAPAPNIPDLGRWVLFQHNVETMIWRRHHASAPDPFRKLYFGLQAARMFAFERQACQAAGHIVAVSPVDRETMRGLFGVERISHITTGVDLEWFAPPPATPPGAHLVFLGSMDWLPNIDGVRYFVREIFPLIRRRRPGCTLAIVGRTPPPSIQAFAQDDPHITVTGTVPDVRPYLWAAQISIVPLRIGGGTRLKIYESMAARVPVVSTSIGAEGLAVSHPDNIRLADTPESFAAACLDLLEDSAARQQLAAAGYELVASRFSWEEVTRAFEGILESLPQPPLPQR